MKKLPSAKTHRTIKLIITLLTATIITAACFIIPLSSAISGAEKNDIPEFSFSSFLSGEYFADFSEWCCNAVPFKDRIMNIGEKFNNILGASYAADSIFEENSTEYPASSELSDNSTEL